MGGVIQGTAPKADLVVQALLSDPLPQRNGKMARELFGNSGKSLGYILADAYDNHNSRIYTNSWGPTWDWATKTQSPYGNGGKELDDFVWARQDLVVCFAAGNDGEERTAVAGAGQVGGQSSAKNCITVGSCDNQRPSKDNTFTAYEEKSDLQGDPNHISGFSSRGPTAEGRIKPDVIAPGAMILSTRSSKAPQQTDFGECKDQAWMFDTGTSMATPLVAGCVAALREHLIKQEIKQPTAALIKALLVNGAVDLKRPTEEQGFGRVDLSNSIFDPSSALDKGFFEDKIYDEDGRDIVKKDILLRHSSLKKGSPVTLKATLVYLDQQGEALQNNINLVVHSNGQKRHGNKGEAQNQYDNINTVEQVIWKGLAVGDTVTFEVSYREAMTADVLPFSVAWSISG
jgi:serine protease AprX